MACGNTQNNGTASTRQSNASRTVFWLALICTQLAVVYWWFRGTDPPIWLLTEGQIEVYVYKNFDVEKTGVLLQGSAGAEALCALFEQSAGLGVRRIWTTLQTN